MAVEISENLFNATMRFFMENPAVQIADGLREAASAHNAKMQGDLSGQMRSRELPDVPAPADDTASVSE